MILRAIFFFFPGSSACGRPPPPRLSPHLAWDTGSVALRLGIDQTTRPPPPTVWGPHYPLTVRISQKLTSPPTLSLARKWLPQSVLRNPAETLGPRVSRPCNESEVKKCPNVWPEPFVRDKSRRRGEGGAGQRGARYFPGGRCLPLGGPPRRGGLGRPRPAAPPPRSGGGEAAGGGVRGRGGAAAGGAGGGGGGVNCQRLSEKWIQSCR